MATLVTYGDRLVTMGGRESWLSRPSVPLSMYGSSGVYGALTLAGDGRTVSYQQMYENQPWVATVVNKLARQVVRLPLGVYRYVNDDGESEPVRGHPLADLLSRPWSRASSATLKQKATFPTLVNGNGLLAKVRSERGAPPDRLVPLDWRCTVPHCDEYGRVMAWELQLAGGAEYLDPSEVVHFAWESGLGDLGISPLAQLGVTLRSEDSAQRYQAASLENGARPVGALVVPPDVRMDEAERDEMRRELRQQHSGDNAFNVALLTGGLDWKAFSHTAVEAELINQRKLNREEVAAVYDVDPPLIGILDHATYSNVGEMHKMLYGPTLGPWLALITETLNAQLVDSEPRWMDERLFVAFDLTEVLKSNTLEEIQAIAAAIGTGVMVPNEGRSRLRLRRSDNPAADVLYMPTNNMNPMGQTPPDQQGAQSLDDVVKSHIARALQIARTKRGAGMEPWDRERFIRELVADAPGVPAELVADTVEAAIAA